MHAYFETLGSDCWWTGIYIRCDRLFPDECVLYGGIGGKFLMLSSVRLSLQVSAR